MLAVQLEAQMKAAAAEVAAGKKTSAEDMRTWEE